MKMKRMRLKTFENKLYEPNFKFHYARFKNFRYLNRNNITGIVEVSFLEKEDIEKAKKLAKEELKERQMQVELRKKFHFDFGYSVTIPNSLTINKYIFRVDKHHKILKGSWNGIIRYCKLTENELKEHEEKYKKIKEQRGKMKKIKTKTNTGIDVILTIGQNEIRAEFEHPQKGKIVSFGKRYGEKNGLSGLHTYAYDVGNIFLTIPQNDVQPLLDEIEKRKIEKEKKVQAEYDTLKSKLPPIPNFHNTPNEKKFKKIMSKISNQYFSGKEDDGLNLAISSENERIRSEARKYCNHNIEITYHNTFTADARKKIERIIECKKCGLYILDTAEEPVSDSAIWR